MAKKKQKKASKPTQTPNSYISSGKARLLPLGDCYITANWMEAGLATIYIPRKHITGNITYGVFLVDIFWKGVVDTDVQFNVPEEESKVLFDSEIDWVPIDYNKAHNIIYGAEAFAADFDIKAHPDFALTRMILEEDDDSIPIIDIEFGKDGKPFKIIRIDDDEYESEEVDYEYEEVDYDNDDYLDQDGFQEAKEEVPPGKQTGAANDDSRQEIIDADLTPLLSGWSSSQWEEFITDPKSQTPGDPFVDEVLLYIFDRCFIDENREPELDWDAVVEKSSGEFYTISSKPVQTDDYIPSAEEQVLYVECYQFIENSDAGNFQKQYKQKVQQLLTGIERWPGNRQLYNALQNIYILSGEERKLEELLQWTVTVFPDYLFGLVNYATHNLRNGKAEMVPLIMKKAYTITGLYPDRSVFHVSEIFSFNQIWFEYYMVTKQMLKARHYRTQLQEKVPPQYSGMKKLRSTFEKFDNYCRVAIKVYLDQASKDPRFRKMMIDILLKYGIDRED
jgi:hypothetical protein